MRNRYFPQYFRANRPYYNAALVGRLQKASETGIQAVNDILMTSMTDAALKSGIQPIDLLKNNFLGFELMAAQTIAQLDVDGTPLYDIDPLLLEALVNSDPGEMQLLDIRSVNRTYYLHWGPQQDLLLHGALTVEGAVVSAAGEDWRIGIVARSAEAWPQLATRDNFFLRFPASTVSRPFSEAVDEAIEIDRADMVAALGSGSRSRDLPSASVLLEHFHATQAVNAPVLKRALMLAGNCMAYLTAYPDDSQVGWQPDTPASMLAKVGRGGKEGGRSLSKLTSLGYLQVHKVGLDFHRLAVESGDALEHAEGEHAARRPHWRRGHWRRQAHGSQMSLRKLVWIRPSRVIGGSPLIASDSAIADAVGQFEARAGRGDPAVALLRSPDSEE
ncbi:hypothetical protein ABIC83_003018 [Roseateles asaccharophilus]|uniref:hypothetical protein n=1 Tax=Roseateles asaccharophilus TaxID=582607 RepID=UPI003838B479